MIQAFIFDLDGTLVKTEQLKALSYARAAVELCPRDVSKDEVIEAFKEFVGLSRREVATGLMKKFELELKAASLTEQFGVKKPWQAYVQVRLKYYEQFLADAELLRDNRWPHANELLERARDSSCKVALATMSHRKQVTEVLEILDLQNSFSVVATRDDVEEGKPDPEIYNLVAAELGVAPENTLVIEDSPAGVKAALAANMHVLAVATPFTKKRLHDAQILPENLIVDDHEQLISTVNTLMAQQA